MRTVSIGPFSDDDFDRWPVFQREELRPDWRVVPYRNFQNIDSESDVTIVWSPEYTNLVMTDLDEYPGYKVACLGDWHIHMPSAEELSDYDLIATDWRGLAACEKQGVSQDSLLWFRMFSFDPRLHSPYPVVDRGIDVAFMGRSDGGPRDELLIRIERWCQQSDKKFLRNHDAFVRGYEGDIYRRAKIVFNYSQRGELNMRCYEAMACGALSVLQHDAIEAIKSGMPFALYDPAHVEDFLESWLSRDATRERFAQSQQKWVAHERPVDHLRYLLTQIEKRLTHEPRNRVDDLDRSSAGNRLVRGGMGSDLVGAKHDPVGGDATRVCEAPSQDEQRPELVALIPPGVSRVLDLGCGFGGLGWRLIQDRIDQHDLGTLTVHGIDASPGVLKTARERLDRVWQFDLNLLDDAWHAQEWYSYKYDCIILADILEHLVDPWSVLERIKPLLAPGGCIVASIPNIRNVANLYELVVKGEWRYFLHQRDEYRGPHDNVLSWAHLRFFTRKSIQELFEGAGYRIDRWDASHLSAPALARFHGDLSHVADDSYQRDAYTIQHLCVATLA